jgi:hypothetical protein
VDFSGEARFDNPRAVQIRLSGFTPGHLLEVGRKIRDLFAAYAATPDRIQARADDRYVADLATAATGRLGGKVGIAPRVFLKKLVVDVLDNATPSSMITNISFTAAGGGPVLKATVITPANGATGADPTGLI